jgi:hypothetical protein
VFYLSVNDVGYYFNCTPDLLMRDKIQIRRQLRYGYVDNLQTRDDVEKEFWQIYEADDAVSLALMRGP